jgi:hypothetical protein
VSADIKATTRCWDDLQTIRAPREGEWRQIAENFAPRKTFDLAPRLRELGVRRVTSSMASSVLGRGAGLFMAYLIDPTRPFIGPNVSRAWSRPAAASSSTTTPATTSTPCSGRCSTA